jgi:hypothetical protein
VGDRDPIIVGPMVFSGAHHHHQLSAITAIVGFIFG